MNALQEALLRAGVVDKAAADRAAGRNGKRLSVRAPDLRRARQQWLTEDARDELLRDPTSEAACRLIREAHQRFQDGTDEFRRFLRPLYELRDQLDRLDLEARAGLILRRLTPER